MSQRSNFIRPTGEDFKSESVKIIQSSERRCIVHRRHFSAFAYTQVLKVLSKFPLWSCHYKMSYITGGFIYSVSPSVPIQTYIFSLCLFKFNKAFVGAYHIAGHLWRPEPRNRIQCFRALEWLSVSVPAIRRSWRVASNDFGDNVVSDKTIHGNGRRTRQIV